MPIKPTEMERIILADGWIFKNQTGSHRHYIHPSKLSLIHILQLAAVMSVVIAVVTSIYCADILHMMSTPENIFTGAYYYLLVTFIEMCIRDR